MDVASFRRMGPREEMTCVPDSDITFTCCRQHAGGFWNAVHSSGGPRMWPDSAALAGGAFQGWRPRSTGTSPRSGTRVRRSHLLLCPDAGPSGAGAAPWGTGALGQHERPRSRRMGKKGAFYESRDSPAVYPPTGPPDFVPRPAPLGQHAERSG